jgi:hypothetical protein
MPSKNQIGADNQQERLQQAGWIVGFTDGEGCFSISIFRNKTTKFGWQVMPEFVITQGASSLPALESIQKYFGCGRIFINKRYDNHHEHMYRYCVRTLSDLRSVIIPFFQQYPLQTNKHKDFLQFCQVVEMMSNRHHFTEAGLQEIAKLVGKDLLSESSETIRRSHSLQTKRSWQDIVRSVRRRAVRQKAKTPLSQSRKRNNRD